MTPRPDWGCMQEAHGSGSLDGSGLRTPEGTKGAAVTMVNGIAGTERFPLRRSVLYILPHAVLARQGIDIFCRDAIHGSF